MSQAPEVDVVAPAALGEAERAAWRAWAADAPSPYFDLRYALAAGETAPGAAVAVIRRGGVLAGFLPFQRRGRTLQPLGAPVTDYHGIVGPADLELDLAELVRACGADRFRYGGLVGPAGTLDPAAAPLATMACDLSAGFDAYMEERQANDRLFFKNARRHVRGLERDHGELSFTFGEHDHDLLDWIIARKREQYRRTRRHDVFACGWTVRLLHRLLDIRDEDFGGRLTVLRAGGQVVSAELGLMGRGVYHLWFPVYDHAFRRYGPGTILTLETLKACAARGLTTVDFGVSGEGYKHHFTRPAMTVLEGTTAAAGARPALAAADALLRRAPRAVRAAGLSFRRRFDVIDACETSLGGWLGGAGAAVAAAALRARRPAGGDAAID